eukprot:COSAG01_NODE_113_length_25617_cov_10.523492_23_plen_105_part_00
MQGQTTNTKTVTSPSPCCSAARCRSVSEGSPMAVTVSHCSHCARNQRQSGSAAEDECSIVASSSSCCHEHGQTFSARCGDIYEHNANPHEIAVVLAEWARTGAQ